MITAISENPSSFKGKVVIIRGEGPKGGPGMPEMLTPTSAIMGAGLGKEVALLTDGSIDVQKRAINVELTDAELNERERTGIHPRTRLTGEFCTSTSRTCNQLQRGLAMSF
ncbi:hypothetical protein F3Y22_tig00110258pilonHSYRG00005 [Hibiscus syriacus]|uniref:Dihydroxy-acid/6-phosphogluconate dehydratase C-terminal domain-containing protein n=1 Tax=Hibiscus syriacus TaxID=106335 RepID=A0A6A3B7H2_HIBSY|nr:hypothetical protein F3Y22_tig00110258pilonHSYRG00005 [Hibiscus syriacus]